VPVMVPDHFYAESSPFAHFKTPSVDIIRYQHGESELVNEVVLNKSLLLFINRGTKRLRVSGEEESLTCAEGVFVPKGSYVMTEVAASQRFNGFESLMVLIDDHFLEDFLQGYRPPLSLLESGQNVAGTEPGAWVRFEKTPFLDSSIVSLQVFFDHPEQVNRMFLEEKVREILRYLLTTVRSHRLFNILKFASGGGRNARLHQFLESHYMEPWTVERFAENFGLSVSTFKRECCNTLGMSPKRWINKRRLDSAKQKLLCSDAPLTQIAFELGFSDGSHFSTAFRKEFNCSPSSYRKNRPGRLLAQLNADTLVPT